MADIDDFIYYFRSLKKGFDKQLFQEKVEELSQTVDTIGLNYEEFEALFKVWLNLSIPVSNWISFGTCLVPRERVQPELVKYILRWLLHNYQCQNFNRVLFLLDWITAALDSDSIDVKSLDLGYEIFVSFLSYEIITPNALKLVYTLTKPADVNRRRVLSLLQLSRVREGKKNKLRQINVLLSLFKSFRPECVPENIPAMSVHSVFKKIKQPLVDRFRKNQALRNGMLDERSKLIWSNSINSMKGRGKNLDPLVPNMKYINIGSNQYTEHAQKNCLDFTMCAEVLSQAARARRPARLRSLLTNDAGLALLAASSPHSHSFFSHDLHHLLINCFRTDAPYSYAEKAYLLNRLAYLQRTLMQGIPVVTMFLSQYLLFWNATDYFAEILQLVQWISLDSPAHLPYILNPLVRLAYRVEPIERLAILRSLTSLYSNLTFSKTKQKLYFLDMEQPEYHTQFMRHLTKYIEEMCTKSLQIDPFSMLSQFSGCWVLERQCRSELRSSCPRLESPPFLLMSLPLLSPSALLIDKVILLLRLYQQIYRLVRKTSPDLVLDEERGKLEKYTIDYISALSEQNPFLDCEAGTIFKSLRPEFTKRILKNFPKANCCYGIGLHYGLASYTYLNFGSFLHDIEYDDKKVFLDAVTQVFPNMKKILS